ncbi:MAG: hypothetical protein SFV24_08070 [Gemmatimonadales bacterium]|nr:hypothetical protein [Gemmatimonadales bacterium]
MRGAEGSTVFDLFSPAGAFLGEVEIDGAVGAFSPAGAWLAVAVETSDGFPVLRRYRVTDDGGR